MTVLGSERIGFEEQSRLRCQKAEGVKIEGDVCSCSENVCLVGEGLRENFERFATGVFHNVRGAISVVMMNLSYLDYEMMDKARSREGLFSEGLQGLVYLTGQLENHLINEAKKMSVVGAGNSGRKIWDLGPKVSDTRELLHSVDDNLQQKVSPSKILAEIGEIISRLRRKVEENQNDINLICTDSVGGNPLLEAMSQLERVELLFDVVRRTNVQEGRLQLQMEYISMSDLIDKFLRLRDGSHGVATTERRGDFSLPVDACLMDQVIDNLVRNGNKFGSHVGVVLDGQRNEDFGVVEVKNYGSRLPKEVERLFDYGFRGDNADGVEGSGLGLYFCDRVVRMHGGRMEAEEMMNEEGQVMGVVFKVFLPKNGKHV